MFGETLNMAREALTLLREIKQLLDQLVEANRG